MLLGMHRYTGIIIRPNTVLILIKMLWYQKTQVKSAELSWKSQCKKLYPNSRLGFLYAEYFLYNTKHVYVIYKILLQVFR